ncbi:MAG: hypothetical protein HGA44_15995 [Cellulomonadaceae bacterium]|nr:hypothetical protein [Cellulomonadaceae bacterium]
MRRLFWVGVGAAGAVVLAGKVRATLHRYTPEGVAEQVGDASQSTVAAVREAVQEFTATRRQRESDLVATLLVTPDGGDPGAVFRRKDPDHGAGSRHPGASSAQPTRPSGRVDDDEPLYDF